MKPRLSIYTRTIIRISLAILAVFVVLGIVYAAIFTYSSHRVRAEDLKRNATEMASLTERFVAVLDIDSIPRELTGYWSFGARSTGALLWVVGSDGELIYSTGIPERTLEQLDRNETNGLLVLDPQLMNPEEQAYSKSAYNTGFRSYLNQPKNWLVASCPLSPHRSRYMGEIILLRPLRPDGFTSFLQSNSVPISFTIAFLLSLIIILFLSRAITKPISELAETAGKVYRGDLTARVKIGKNHEPLTLTEEEEAHDSKSEDDLTLLVRTFNTLISKFEQQEKTQSEFLSSVSHDLRTPVTSIRGFISGMLDGTVPPEKYEYYLGVVKAETERLQSLIDSLFDQAVTGEVGDLNPTVFSINALLEGIRRFCEPMLREKRLTFELMLDPDEDNPKVLADEKAVTRVINNIVMNAIKFAPEAGLVLVRTKAEERRVVISVEDNGPGIPDEALPYVFDRFFKVDKSRHSGGSGLGLYNARSLIKRHGQMIRAGHSELGGACIEFTLAKP